MRRDPVSLTPDMRVQSTPMATEVARQLEALMPDLRRVARQLCGTWARADDLVQETLIALWLHPETLDPDPETLRLQVFEALRARVTEREKSARDVA